jgi:hypothetical protein
MTIVQSKEVPPENRERPGVERCVMERDDEDMFLDGKVKQRGS